MLALRVVVGAGIVALGAGCSLFPDVAALSGGDGGSSDATVPDTGADAADAADAATDTGPDATDSGADAACSCTGIVSEYRFADTNNLGHDFFGTNNMTTVIGSPQQSTTTPPGLTGYSLQLDGSSTVCIDTGFTFDSTADHTLCWWSQAAALANSTNQFAQACGYDTWTTNSGADYLWRINNCNSGTAANLQVSNVFAVGKWVEICQTYDHTSMTRTVVIDGQTNQKHVLTDTAPIVEDPSSPWCIGSYGSGGYWTGLIYLPMWFDRILSDTEIQQVYANACCLP
jgi:hypothetical protein